MDPSLLQDFLTESGELIEQLDTDLVKLEAAESAEEAQELCNGCFRALHTIKGAASFLGLSAVTTFAHAAEDTLNKLRKGEIDVTETVMDALLQSADVVKGMIDELSAGDEAQDGPQELIDTLHALAEGAAEASADSSTDTPPTQSDAPSDQNTSGADDDKDDGKPGTPLNLGPQKLDLLEFMVTDLQDAAKQIGEATEGLDNDATREESANLLAEVCEEMGKTAEFFELDELTSLIKVLNLVAGKINDASHEAVEEIAIRIKAAKTLIDQQAQALTDQRALSWPLDTLCSRLTALAENGTIDPPVNEQHHGDIQQLLVIDGVIEPPSDKTAAPQTDAPPTETDASTTPAATTPNTQTNTEAAAKDPDKATKDKADAKHPPKPVAEQTIRVEVSRLESLLNLVGQLVLNKNRVLALTRNIKDQPIPPEMAEDFSDAAEDLDHLMSELQVGVMRTRMQPLAKLFDRYPRVIRDMAKMTHKQINLEIVGKDTEVDKTVLEQLADPLVHILRNSSDHGVESPEDRKKAGKSEAGTIRLEAEHQGSHVRVAISDDGNGLDRNVLGQKAVEKGLTTPEKLETLPDEDVFAFIFAAGFSTAKQVSDLSGRGVGMDVVRTNINKLNGTINIFSKKGQGTTIEILIPLTVAIMPAMVVGVGNHVYSIPLQSIVEIVRPEPEEIKSVSGHPVMQLRDIVLPLVDMRKRLDEPPIENGGRFAVVVAVGGQRMGLCVDRLVGQQEIVIKPLDDSYTQGGPFSGATIQEDGEVCLILDVVQLTRNNTSTLNDETKLAA
jgi:two-component system, chemotaxis family, sensor kinase CheA